jgi:uncharacterized protein (DUF2336 family)
MEADEAVRVRQSACVTTSPDVLWALARDPSVTVRIGLALNPALPPQISYILAADSDPRVRTVLSRRFSGRQIIGQPDAGLDVRAAAAAEDQHFGSGEGRQRTQQEAVASLTAMIAEAGLRIRANIAETVKDMPNGLRDTVLRLAYDPALTVCGPVIRSSPVLSSEDLVTLLGTRPPASTIIAVAGRPKIGASVSDAIVETSNASAISVLLANVTAQIRDATLDALAAQSEDQVDWQAPLVRRPHLPLRAQRMLSEFVKGQLVNTLAARGDLDPMIAMQLQSALGRVHVKPAPSPMQSRPTGSQAPPAMQAVEWPRSNALTAAPAADPSRTGRARAQQLQQTGKLDDRAIFEALRRDAKAEAKAMLAVKSDLPTSVIDRACDLRSAKAIVSLAWKAGLPASTAVALQAALAGLPSDLIIEPEPNGAYALSENEMRSQLSFLGVEEIGPRAWVPRRLVR